MEHLQALTGGKTGRLASSGRFKGFKPEPERAVRIPEIKSNPILIRLAEAWNRLDYMDSMKAVVDWDMTYPDIPKALRNIEFNAKDIEAFSLIAIVFQKEPNFQIKAGLFLSALVNLCQESDFYIHVRHLALPPSSLGFQNAKNVVVDGDVGREFGAMMSAGVITVKGNAGPCAGEMMQGGEIVIEGNCGANAGTMMNGGRLIIRGHADHDAGFEMNSGKICLDGTYDSISQEIYGGFIFHGKEMLFHEK